jgi:class 3 adenylate cyclase/tetratricopeptide (TPR) repeat protein
VAASVRKPNDSSIRVIESAVAENLDGERKTVTALFADIKSSMELMEDLDPEEARAIIDPALKLMIEAMRRYDGYIVQSTGDGIFALFGAPIASEDHPQRALYAALRMQDEMRRYSTRLREAGNPPIEARVGINTGEVVVRSLKTGDGQTEYTPIGLSTSLAARMQALAPVGSIAVTETTERLCAGYFSFKALGPARVKGVTEPVNVFEVTGLGPLRTRFQRATGRGLTKFVGREREMETLKHAAELARQGHGQIVAATAEPGVGKTRLYFEFKATSQTRWMLLETFSISHGKASAYLPVLDLLHGYFKIASGDDERTRREKVAGRLAMLDPSLEVTRPYLFSLLGIVEGADPLAPMDGQLKKRRTLEAIKRILLRESLNQPLMVIFEDWHWIDEATQEFLNLLADSLGTAKLLLLVNYRPEYSHEWNSKTYYTQLRLDPLGKESADAMLDALLTSPAAAALSPGASRERARPEPAASTARGEVEGSPGNIHEALLTSPAPAALSAGANWERSRGDIHVADRVRAQDDLPPLKRLIIERTEGNPFFMEEIVQVLLDEGALVRDGAGMRLTKPLDPLRIPPTVQAILAARIDRLPSDAKELLQTLAVTGREFPLSLIQAVVARSDEELDRLLNDLQLGEFIYEQPATGGIEYIFKHALTQEVAYNSVLVERRRQLHERTAAALEMLYASTVEEHLAELAHHYVRSSNLDKAVEYLTRAGRQALNRSAYAEAQAQLQQGVESIKKLPPSPERDRCELELMGTLAQVLMVTRGFSAQETRAAAERARDLAEKGGNLVQLVTQVIGKWQVAGASGDYSTAGLLAEQILELAQREGSPASFGFAHRAQIQVSFARGDLTAAENCFAGLIHVLDADAFRQFPGAAVEAIGIAAICAAVSGRAESARERMAKGIAFARDSGRPYDLAVGRLFEVILFCFLREPVQAEVAARHGLSIAEEHGFPFVMALTRPLLGWAWAQIGRAREGAALIRQGLAGLAASASRVAITIHLSYLAEAQALVGKIDDAFIAIEEALAANPEEVVYRPEALTYRGELRLKLRQVDLAETDFREAITLAKKIQAKTYELRATTSLARLLRDANRRDEARTMLAEIYNWFTEGFDTVDLKNAKQLLNELGQEF